MTTQPLTGIIARAKTFGGGHITITAQGTVATATCTGCPETHTAICNWPGLDTDQQRRDRAIYETRQWARTHASCPFIPGSAA